MRNVSKIYSSILCWVVLTILYSVLIPVSSQAFSACGSDHNYIYIVEEGDALYKIALMYGDFRFWEAIYIANADNIEDPDLIYTGQSLSIPESIHTFTESNQSLREVLKTPFCDIASLSVSEVDFSRLSLYTQSYFSKVDLAGSGSEPGTERNETILLDEFREAFESVVDTGREQKEGSEDDPIASNNRDAIQQQSERQIMMEIDGMVLDETRSKVGRDFYDVFYTNWQQPPDTHNFSIRISEQPSPSLGTIIYVEVNDRETFRMRLQPRYDFIQQAGRYAVRQTYSYLQNNDHQLQIY